MPPLLRHAALSKETRHPPPTAPTGARGLPGPPRTQALAANPSTPTRPSTDQHTRDTPPKSPPHIAARSPRRPDIET